MNLRWFDKPEELLAKGAARTGMNVFPLYEGPFPLVTDGVNPDGTDGPRQNFELVYGKVFKVVLDADEYITTVVCRTVDDPAGAAGAKKPQWAVYCGDKQVQGIYRTDGKQLADKLRKEGIVSNKICNVLEASEWVGKAEESPCNFFSMQARNPDKFCTHTTHLLSNLTASELEPMAPDLLGWQKGDDAGATVVELPKSEEEIAFYDAAFIQPVLLAGERGSGKSYLARQAADRYDAVYLEMQMHPSMEAWEFRAHDRAWNGKVYTVMGKLAEAVYWIQKGKKVVLCMDEFLNMNPIYTTAINTPLTLTANDTYIIETGRIIDMGDGIGRLETVEVPSDMFWVVATSNIGARYGLDKIAPSVRARFQIILMNTNPERTQSILEKTLTQYAMPLELAELFKKFIEACNQAVQENTLDEEATTRLACNVIRAVYKRANRDKKKYTTLSQWIPHIKKQLMAEIAQVVNFELGPLDSDQASLYKSLVDATFKVKSK